MNKGRNYMILDENETEMGRKKRMGLDEGI